MRLIPLVVAAFVASSCALAQSWQEYAFPELFFALCSTSASFDIHLQVICRHGFSCGVPGAAPLRQ
jgi:hypothetical protein